MKVKIWKFLFRTNTFFHLFIFLEYLPCLSTVLGRTDDQTWNPFKRILDDRGYYGLHQWLSGKEFNCNSEDPGSIPRSGRSPQGGHGNSLQYSCLGNSMHKGAWRAIVPGVAKSQTQLKQLSMHIDIYNPIEKKEIRITFSSCKQLIHTFYAENLKFTALTNLSSHLIICSFPYKC